MKGGGCTVNLNYDTASFLLKCKNFYSTIQFQAYRQHCFEERIRLHYYH